MISGIYKIVNTKDGKVYIGQAENIKKRFQSHKYQLRTNTHYNAHLQRAYNKHGKECFLFEIIEECAIEKLNMLESYYISILDTTNDAKGYNLTTGGDSTRVIQSSKKKMRLASAQRWKDENERKKMSRSKSTVDESVVALAKKLMYMGMSNNDIMQITGLNKVNIAHIGNIDSHEHVCKRFNDSISKRNKLGRQSLVDQVLTLYKAGNTYKTISEILEMHQRTVIRICNKHKCSRDVVERAGSGALVRMNFECNNI